MMDTTWFDLASPRRRVLAVTGHPAHELHEAVLEFAPGSCPTIDTVTLAATYSVPHTIADVVAHDDGSIARCRVVWPEASRLPTGRPTHIALYYGAAGPPRSEAEAEPGLVTWDAATRRIDTPYYRLVLGAWGNIRSLVLPGIEEEMLGTPGSPGLYPAFSPAHGHGWIWPLDAPARVAVTATGTEAWCDLGLSWEDAALAVRLRFLPAYVRMEYRTRGQAGVSVFPVAAGLRRRRGYLIGPDDWRGAMDQSGRIMTRSEPWSGAGFHVSSQSGMACLSLEASRSPDRFIYDDTHAGCTLAGLGFGPGDDVSGTVAIVPLPYDGDATLGVVRQLATRLTAPDTAVIRVVTDEPRPTTIRVYSSAADNAHHLAAGPLDIHATPGVEGYRVQVASDGVVALTARDYYVVDTGEGVVTAAPEWARIEGLTLALRARLRDGAGRIWRAHSLVRPRLIDGTYLFDESRAIHLEGTEMVEVGLAARWTTTVGAPLWREGRRTVVMPGQMARGNAHPDYPHGGGPKWGPESHPTLCPKCTGDIPGHCDHWSVPASRLPNVWVAAADAEAAVLGVVGTLPRSTLGETAAGFHAPAMGSTELRLYTPGVYEPWVPLGYGAMSGYRRRDRALVSPDVPARWRLFYSGAATRDLNGWSGFDHALYHLGTGQRPKPYKIEPRDALTLMAERLFRAHYHPDHGLISYSDRSLGSEGLGFTGMGQSACALLMAGDLCEQPLWREAGRTALDRIATACLDGPDFPYAYITSGGYKAGGPEPGYVIMAGLDTLQRALLYEVKRGHQHPAWLAAIVRASGAWARWQRADGAYPHRHPAMDPDRPEAVDYESTNVEVGVIGCLTTTYQLTGDERFLASARLAAGYYGRLLDDGKLYGGPGDIEALVNSEVPMWYLRGFLRLWQATGSGEHRRLTLVAAAWRFSVQFGHAWPVDAGSPLYRQGWCGLGGECASASNLHMVAMGALNLEDYRTLYDLMGDDYARQRYADLLQYATQQVARFDGDLGMPRGGSVESFWASDATAGKGFVTVYDFAGHMAWVIGWAALAICTHLLAHSSSQP